MRSSNKIVGILICEVDKLSATREKWYASRAYCHSGEVNAGSVREENREITSNEISRLPLRKPTLKWRYINRRGVRRMPRIIIYGRYVLTSTKSWE